MTLNRRVFLKSTAGAGIVTTGLLQPWRSMAMAAEKTQDDFDDYKALVFLLFSGGMDSFNLLVPFDDDEYSRYADIRSDLKFERSDLLELDGAETDRRFSVPSVASGVRDLFNEGDLSFLANVGPLSQHLDREQFLDETQARPLNLESHSDQAAQWQTTDSRIPLPQQTVGWMGRVSDRFGSTLNNGLGMNVSMTGFNLAQANSSGTPVLIPTMHEHQPFAVLDDDPLGLEVKARSNLEFELGRFDNRYDNLLQNEYLKRFKRSIEDSNTGSVDFLDGRISPNTSFTSDSLGKTTDFGPAMKRIVEIISAHSVFGGGTHRQTFFVEHGGWDHHRNLHDYFNWRVEEVSFVLKAFRDARVEIDMLDNVVLFTASEFGRTLASNGGGSDHGWGGNAMILGGNVNGGQVLGEYPEMDLEGDQVSNTDRGIFIPNTSLEEYYSELALWFGLDEEDLELAFPNVDSFIPDESTKPEKIGIFETEVET